MSLWGTWNETERKTNRLLWSCTCSPSVRRSFSPSCRLISTLWLSWLVETLLRVQLRKAEDPCPQDNSKAWFLKQTQKLYWCTFWSTITFLHHNCTSLCGRNVIVTHSWNKQSKTDLKLVDNVVKLDGWATNCLQWLAKQKRRKQRSKGDYGDAPLYKRVGICSLLLNGACTVLSPPSVTARILLPKMMSQKGKTV